MTSRHLGWIVAIAWLVASPAVFAQGRRGAAATASAAMRSEPAKVNCPQVLGVGVQTGRTFCEVVLTRDPAEGIIVPLPPHTGAVTLTFDLHNRHTYSEELSKSARGFRRYTALIGLLASDNTPLGRAVVHNEFRTAKDLFDRVGGGTGAAGLKAVAPTGVEAVTIVIPSDEPTETVSIVGLKLTEARVDGTSTTEASSGRPIATISNVMLQYRPAPPRPPARRK